MVSADVRATAQAHIQLVQLVRAMRELQLTYFKSRHPATLRTCKQFEKSVDRCVGFIAEMCGGLFDGVRTNDVLLAIEDGLPHPFKVEKTDVLDVVEGAPD